MNDSTENLSLKREDLGRILEVWSSHGKGFRLIYVSQEQLDQVEYLIQQSQQGNHVLFDADSIRETFRTQSERFSEEKAYAVEHHIEKLLKEPTLLSKKAYLDQLDNETYRLVLRTYFNIVENSVYEKLQATH